MTKNQLHELLEYAPETGDFRWRESGKGRSTIRPAGYLEYSGYIMIQIFGRRYLAHRLAWLYVYGDWPKHGLDHINGNITDNRIENLRDVPQSVNMRNMTKRKDNKSGHTGICWNKACRKWQANIADLYGKHTYLGLFDDIGDAILAREEAKIKYGYSNRHGVEV